MSEQDDDSSLSNDDEFGSDQENEEAMRAHLSEKGRRMANSIAEYLLMRFFFGPEIFKDSKKSAMLKQAFMVDM